MWWRPRPGASTPGVGHGFVVVLAAEAEEQFGQPPLHGLVDIGGRGEAGTKLLIFDVRKNPFTPLFFSDFRVSLERSWPGLGDRDWDTPGFC